MADRRERVILELVDGGFSTSVLKDAAAVALLEKSLKSLDGTTVNVHQRLSESATSVDRMSSSARNADGSINQLTGRLRVLAEVAAVLGPSLTPIGGIAVAGIGGLANQMGIAAVAGGVLIGSLQGVGDALSAMNKAQLEPTEKNLQKAKDALKALSPAARDFAKEAFALKPALVALRDIGAEALMPGLTESLDSLEDLGPRVGSIMEAFGTVLGDIAEDSSASLASDRWADFFSFIETEGPATMQALATTVGDLAHGFSELWEAFTPLNGDFNNWLMNVADGFDDWATGLSATDGFTEFVDYIRETGPQVADTFGALFDAVVQFVQATAPLGGPVLAGIEAAANAFATIADSDLGTPILAGVAALSLLNRSLAVTASLSSVSLGSGLFAGLGTVAAGAKTGAGGIKALGGDLSTLSTNFLTAGKASERMAAQNKKALDNIKGTARAVGPTAGLLGGLAVATTGVADGFGLTNTASLALMGTLGGPPGVAIGAAAGALLDLRAAGQGATEAIQGLDAAVQSGDQALLAEQIAAAKDELADITNLDFGTDIFDRIGFQVADTFGGPSMDDAREKIEASERALQDLARAEGIADSQARGAALAFLAQTNANVDLGEWAGKSTEQIKAQADAILVMREEADKTARSFVGLGDSLDDSKVSLDDWIRDMASTADALNNFTNNSRTAAKRGLDDGLIRSLQAAGEQGALRMRQLANGTKGSIDEANAAFRKGEKAIERYNNYKVPPKKVTADTSRAMQSFREVDTYLSSLNGKTATTYVNTVRTVTGPQGAAVFGQRADGGSVPKDNGPYRDKFLFMLAPGEEVISNRNGQADQFRADRAAGRIPGYADGGTTGRKGDKRKPQGGLFAADNTSALEEAINRLTMVSEDQTRALDDATAKQEFWASKMSDLAQATVAGFNTGLFEKSDNPWAAGASGGPLGNLAKDIAGLQERSGLQSQLAEMGLSGDALSALLSEGSNSDISALLSSGQVSQYADLYNQRAALQGSVGASAGQQAYGAEASAAQATVRVLEAGLRETNLQVLRMSQKLDLTNELLAEVGNDFGAQLNGSAAKGHRDKKARGGPR